MKTDMKAQILDALKRHDSVPIYQIARYCEISVATASKYCYVLEAERKVKLTSFGNMKLVSKK